MPQYVYRCGNCGWNSEETHSIHEDPTFHCPACRTVMHRVPQVPLAIAHSPFDILADWSEENWGRYKARKRGQRAPRFSPDHVNSPFPISKNKRR